MDSSIQTTKGILAVVLYLLPFCNKLSKKVMWWDISYRSLMCNLSVCFFPLFQILCLSIYFLSICSTSQRGVAWAPRRTGERGRMHPHLSERRELSTARIATALVWNHWSSTWPVSTCWRANNPGNSHPLVCPLFAPGDAHRPPHLSREHVIQRIFYSPHSHSPTIQWARADGWRWWLWVSHSLNLLSGGWIKMFTEKADPSSLYPEAV